MGIIWEGRKGGEMNMCSCLDDGSCCYVLLDFARFFFLETNDDWSD